MCACSFLPRVCQCKYTIFHYFYLWFCISFFELYLHLRRCFHFKMGNMNDSLFMRVFVELFFPREKNASNGEKKCVSNSFPLAVGLMHCNIQHHQLIWLNAFSNDGNSTHNHPKGWKKVVLELSFRGKCNTINGFPIHHQIHYSPICKNLLDSFHYTNCSHSLPALLHFANALNRRHTTSLLKLSTENVQFDRMTKYVSHSFRNNKLSGAFGSGHTSMLIINAEVNV